MIDRRRTLLHLGYGLLLALMVTGILLVVTRRPAGFPVTLGELPTPLPLRVDVEGAVALPGVYTLVPGSILQDALRAAGGPSAKGDASRLNLAHRLQDGDQVFVPDMASTASPSASASARANTTTAGPSATRGTKASAPAGGNLININTATAAELTALPHIGPALAQRIVDYRNAHGPFAAIADIRLVRGIGQGIFAKIKDLITVH
jgi:competence protein ComEA